MKGAPIHPVDLLTVRSCGQRVVETYRKKALQVRTLLCALAFLGYLLSYTIVEAWAQAECVQQSSCMPDSYSRVSPGTASHVQALDKL